MKIEKTITVNKQFFDVKIVAPNVRSRKVRGIVLSHLPARFAFLLAISAILLLPSLSVTQINQKAWAGAFPGPNGQIVFSSNRDGNYKIYSMNADDGSDVTRLTDTSADDFDPTWSPDGTKIAFSSNRGNGIPEIYTMNADGNNVTRLTNNDVDDFSPTWSPDGTKIAFTSFRDEGDDGEVFVMNADDGSDVTRLTDTSADDGNPTWSPDGTKIAFESNRDGNLEIYVMNADDGSEQTRLTNNDANNEVPDWGTNTSPPGSDSTPNPSEQAIHEAISTIRDQDLVPKELKTGIIALLGEVSNMVN